MQRYWSDDPTIMVDDMGTERDTAQMDFPCLIMRSLRLSLKEEMSS